MNEQEKLRVAIVDAAKKLSDLLDSYEEVFTDDLRKETLVYLGASRR